MSFVSKLALVLCGLLVIVVGCRGKEPARPSAKNSEGPILAPPQQSNSATQEAAQPTEGSPGGKTSTSAPPTSPNSLAAQPTEGDPTANATSPTRPEAGKDANTAEKIKANLASLSTNDRALAEKQKICPVSGEPLGGMGAPKKITVAGREVFICCEGCEDTLKKEPAKYLAKVGLEPAK